MPSSAPQQKMARPEAGFLRASYATARVDGFMVSTRHSSPPQLPLTRTLATKTVSLSGLACIYGRTADLSTQE
ncbi:hypothetical protein E2C01_011897 [Portunus trituberculatus]|uniref:Uncharacterized protein n=1 Tax=Portunus trituberculatus TaxID=210409 RepID=A0A5B7DCK1_PORTR|nr:hypothetical protein [Portunus trituberculatus]